MIAGCWQRASSVARLLAVMGPTAQHLPPCSGQGCLAGCPSYQQVGLHKGVASDSCGSLSSWNSDSLHQPSLPGCDPVYQVRPKSLKRRAAEALLAARYCGPQTASHTQHDMDNRDPISLQHAYCTSTATESRDDLRKPSEETTATTFTPSLLASGRATTKIPRRDIQKTSPSSRLPSLAPHAPRPSYSMPRPQDGARTSLQPVHLDAPLQSTSLHHVPRATQSSQVATHDTASQAADVQPPTPVSPSTDTLPRTTPPKCLHIQQCDASCPCHARGWCQHPVLIPHVDWGQVFRADPTKYSCRSLGAGYTKYMLSHGLQVLLVENPQYADAAIKVLRDSMLDPVLAIDLEWQPDHGRGKQHGVALMQISSATTCVLVHVSAMSFKMPAAVRALLTDPDIIMLGFSWEVSDETKMQQTFKCSKRDFGNFLDLLDVARDLGYPKNVGLGRLTRQVLRHDPGKTKKVSRSNWASKKLSPAQIKYAAMDAFVTGQVYRCLRVWHASPDPCPGCKHPVGVVMEEPVLVCEETQREYHDYKAYVNNCAKRGLPMKAFECHQCGRFVSITTQPGTAAGTEPQR